MYRQARFLQCVVFTCRGTEQFVLSVSLSIMRSRFITAMKVEFIRNKAPVNNEPSGFMGNFVHNK